jgi:hypothetical protein
MGGPASSAHNNRDPGSFQLWRGGRWISRQTVGYINDVAGYNYGKPVDTTDSVAHNTVLIDGRGVTTAYPQKMKGLPIMHRLQTDPAFTYADVDLTPVYRTPSADSADNPAAVHVEREYLFVRSLETLVVLDRLQSDTAARAKTFLLHSETSPTVEDAQHVTLTNGTQALRMTTLVPANPTIRVVNEQQDGSGNQIPNDAKLGQYRVEVDTTGDPLSYILTVLQAKDASAAALAPSVVSTSAGFTVSLGSSVTISFVTGATSSGGSISIGGTKTNLRADVQGISVTDDGPVWAP